MKTKLVSLFFLIQSLGFAQDVNFQNLLDQEGIKDSISAIDSTYSDEYLYLLGQKSTINKGWILINGQKIEINSTLQLGFGFNKKEIRSYLRGGSEARLFFLDTIVKQNFKPNLFSPKNIMFKDSLFSIDYIFDPEDPVIITNIDTSLKSTLEANYSFGIKGKTNWENFLALPLEVYPDHENFEISLKVFPTKEKNIQDRPPFAGVNFQNIERLKTFLATRMPLNEEYWFYLNFYGKGSETGKYMYFSVLIHYQT